MINLHFSLGNYGSHFVDILVRHSMSGNEFVSLIPTFTFMSVPESKQAANKCKVEMFKRGMFMGKINFSIDSEYLFGYDDYNIARILFQFYLQIMLISIDKLTS